MSQQLPKIKGMVSERQNIRKLIKDRCDMYFEIYDISTSKKKKK